MKLIIGTRESKWALAATQSITRQIQSVDSTVHLQLAKLSSLGDVSAGDLSIVGGTISFVDSLSRQIAARKIDAAVHTVKDVSWPSEHEHFPDASVFSEGIKTSGDLVIAAVTKRNDPRDVLVLRANDSLQNLLSRDDEIKVGTSSLLRAKIFQNLYPDPKCKICPIRGNTDARLQKLDAGAYDVLLLSMDGLLAVGQHARASHILEIETMPPALGQGMGAVEVLRGNREAVAVLSRIADASTTLALRAEWSTMRALRATCHTPLGGLCKQNDDGTLTMFAVMVASDGSSIRASVNQMSAADPEAVGMAIAAQLIEKGAKAFESSWKDLANGLSQDAC